MKIRIVQTESEWSQPSLGCYVSVNNKLIDVITPLNDPHELNPIEIIPEGFLRLVVRDMGKSDGYLGSVSISINLLSNLTSSVTLPLFNSPNNDTLHSIPSSAQAPRVTVLVINETECERSPVHKEKADFKGLSCEGLEESLGNTPKYEWDNEENDVMLIFKKEMEKLNEDLVREKEKNNQAQVKYAELMNTLKMNCERAQQREGLLLELIAEKEEKISKNIEINLKLQGKVRKLEFDCKQMTEKVLQFEFQEKYVKQLESELKKYQEILIKVEKTRDELTHSLVEQSLTESSPEKVVSTFSEKMNDNESTELNDLYIKKVIQKSIDKTIPLSSIVRIRDCLYKIHEVEVSLAICDDGLYAKLGSKLIALSEFWKLSHPINPSHQVLSIHSENEKTRKLSLVTSNFESRNSPGLKFNAKSFSSIYSKRN